MAQQKAPQGLDIPKLIAEIRPHVIDVFLQDTRRAESFLNNTMFFLASADPKVVNSTRRSIKSGIMTAAHFNLNLGFNGECFLVGYKNKGTLEAQFQTGYKGLMRLVYRSNRVTAIEARAVYECDAKGFDYEFGTSPFIKHTTLRRTTASKNMKLLACYAIATLPNGHQQFDVLEAYDMQPIIEIAKRGGLSGAWVNFESEMWKKSVLNRLLKVLPGMDDDVASAVTLNDLADAGEPQKLEETHAEASSDDETTAEPDFAAATVD